MKDIFDADDISDIPKELLPHKRRVLKYPNAPRWKDNPLAYWKWYQKNVRKKRRKTQKILIKFITNKGVRNDTQS